MREQVGDVHITKLLYEISTEFEKRIKELEAENNRLKYLLNESVLFRLERDIKKISYRIAKKFFLKIKDIIIWLGLKEYVKHSFFYQIYIKRRGGR